VFLLSSALVKLHQSKLRFLLRHRLCSNAPVWLRSQDMPILDCSSVQPMLIFSH
jgi:hypothetical protein